MLTSACLYSSRVFSVLQFSAVVSCGPGRSGVVVGVPVFAWLDWWAGEGQGHCHSPASQCQPEPDSLSRVRQQHAPSPLWAPASTLIFSCFSSSTKTQYIETLSRDLLFQMWRVYVQSQWSQWRTTIICKIKIFHFFSGAEPDALEE